MATILRVDTPDELRDLDAYLGRPAVAGRIALSVIMAAASPIVLVIAIVGGWWTGIVMSVLWFLVWTGWIFRLWHRLKAARPYRVPVRLGIDEIGRAHNAYRKLSLDSQQYALPLVDVMYRLSVVPVRGQYGERRVVNEMRGRSVAIERLLAVEDDIQIGTAQPLLQDRDDVATAEAYRAALDEVQAKLTVGDLAV
jgi:hypothetical protein